MILGIFGGRTAQSIARRIARLQRKEESIREAIARAVADRAAAIASLSDEVAVIEGLGAGLADRIRG